MKLKYIIFTLSFLLTSVGYSDNQVSIEPSNKMDYLKNPTGRYGVGFENFHWVNQNACPDINFTGKNPEDFSPENTKHCHEIVARIYYPTTIQSEPSSPYYPPLIDSQIQQFKQQPSTSKAQLEQLTKIKSFSLEKAKNVRGKKFPVLLFSPGFDCPSEEYENFITELVSQGYIVVGINTPFINLVALPNGHVVKPVDLANVKNIDRYISGKLVPLQSQDLIYVYNKLHNPHSSKNLFSSMDLTHIGLFGHSIGARTLADVAYTHPAWFQAIAPLDIGTGSNGEPLKKLKNITIPVMYQISSLFRVISPYMPVTFGLNKNGYLVGIAPNELNHSYSHHLNFTDFSTLQYLPIYKTQKEQRTVPSFNFKLMPHYPTRNDIAAFTTVTYVLAKQKNTWEFFQYFASPNIIAPRTYIDIDMIDGLSAALSALPNKPIDQLSNSEIEPIKKIVTSFNASASNMLGTGNGWEITDSINTYLVQFFNTYLKGEENPSFKKCIPLHKDTYIKCGPAQTE